MRIYADNRRYSKYAAICGGAGLLGVLIGGATWWVGGPVVVIFFGAAVYLVRRAVSQAAQITIDEDGLGGARLPQQLAWAEIDSIEHTTRSARYRTMHFLEISPSSGRTFEVSLMDLLTPPEAIIELVGQFREVA